MSKKVKPKKKPKKKKSRSNNKPKSREVVRFVFSAMKYKELNKGKTNPYGFPNNWIYECDGKTQAEVESLGYEGNMSCMVLNTQWVPDEKGE